MARKTRTGGNVAARAWPADRVERWPIGKLKPYGQNPRTHSREQVEQIAESMRRWGWTNPVLVDESGELIAGHGRVAAAKLIGTDAVPVMVARGWSDAEKRAYVIADNKLAENAGWDDELLRSELQWLRAEEFDLGLIGFDEKELDDLLSDDGVGAADAEATPELPAEPVSRLGDLWQLGGHRLICGDCTKAEDVSAVLADAKPRLMVTDPPYGVSYDPGWRARAGVSLNRKKMGTVANDDRADWRETWALFPGDVAYVWHGGLHAATVVASLEAAGFAIRTQIIWAKDRFALSRGDYHWQHEPCWYAVRKGVAGGWTGDRSQTTLWQIPAREDQGHGHGTQKPVECMRRPIVNNSKRGDAIYEPFSGSGTTIIAAEMTGRRVFALEISPAYVDVAVRRWQEFSGKEARLEATGKTFAETARKRGVPA